MNYLKKILITCLCFSLPIFAKVKPVSILDLYAKFPNKLLKPMYKEKLYYLNSKWKIKFMGLFRDAIVDMKNGYLSYSLSPTGANGWDLSMAKYFDNSNNIYLVFSVDVWDAITDRNNGLKIYKFSNGKFFNVTSKLFPKIELTYFFKKTTDYSKIKQIAKRSNNSSIFTFQVPRFGTTIKVYLTRCLSSNSYVMKQIKRREILLKWNYKKGYFYY